MKNKKRNPKKENMNGPLLMTLLKEVKLLRSLQRKNLQIREEVISQRKTKFKMQMKLYQQTMLIQSTKLRKIPLMKMMLNSIVKFAMEHFLSTKNSRNIKSIVPKYRRNMCVLIAI